MSPLILLNKPYGVISQFSPHETHPTLKNYIDLPGYYPAGRLDTDSEGLLLLTNDGKLQAQISSPKFKLAKTYWAQVEGEITDSALKQLQRGVKLNDFTTAPAKADRLSASPPLWARTPPIRVRQTIPTVWIAITICEGKNRQVRRMCAAVGFPCLRLVRVQMGPLNLLDARLAPGNWQFIAPTKLNLPTRPHQLKREVRG